MFDGRDYKISIACETFSASVENVDDLRRVHRATWKRTQPEEHFRPELQTSLGTLPTYRGGHQLRHIRSTSSNFEIEQSGFGFYLCKTHLYDDRVENPRNDASEDGKFSLTTGQFTTILTILQPKPGSQTSTQDLQRVEGSAAHPPRVVLFERDSHSPGRHRQQRQKHNGRRWQ